MIFKEIELQNFRQYGGKNFLSFDNNSHTINLIIAQNGVGKTTFLQAIRYCFFGDTADVLNLPKSQDLLNYEVAGSLDEAKVVEVSVKIKFEHQDKSYQAIRTTKFRKFNGEITKYKDTTFDLMFVDGFNGYKSLSSAQGEMLRIIPASLAYIYMFDGERSEQRITSKVFMNTIKNSITGVLGLDTLNEVIKILGSTNIRSTILGKINAKYIPENQSEKEVLEKEVFLKKSLEESSQNIKQYEKNLIILSEEVKKTEEVQLKINEIKSLASQREILNRDLIFKKEQKAKDISCGTEVALELLFKIELAKSYSKYKKFENNGKNVSNTEIFEGLHESVIKTIKNKNMCICGREICDGTAEWDFLTSLSVLPHDNSPYLMQIESMYRQLDEEKDLQYKKIFNYKKNIVLLQKEIKEIEFKIENINKDIRIIEETHDLKKLQSNNDALKQHIGMFKNKLNDAKRINSNSESDLRKISSKLQKIKLQNIQNSKISKVIEELQELKRNLLYELESKKNLGKNFIENNMNNLVSKIMNGDLRISLSDDYELKVERKLIDKYDEESWKDETEKLSTGQNVVLYLAFIRSLFKTISDSDEFENVKNGIVMDAALSNVDEKHIGMISKMILPEFDQLIFLSFGRQLRGELIEGILPNVANVYVLEKDQNSNISINKLPVEKLESFISAESEDE